MAVHPGWPATLVEGPVMLRPHRYSDAADWSAVRLANEGWLSPWEPTRPNQWRGANDSSQFPALLRSFRRGARRGEALPWVISYQGQFAGQLTVSNIVRGAFCSASVGYWVDGRLAGRGIMPTALAMAVDHSFTAARLHRIEVNIRPENAASRRVVEKLGFREEGQHARFLHIDGEWRDHLGYALTVEDVVPDGLLSRWRHHSSRN